MLATSGLRLNEVLSLDMTYIDFATRTIRPKQHSGRTKSSWISLFNEEAEAVLKDYLKESGIKEGRIFPVSDRVIEKSFLRTSAKSGIKITPKSLRAWFSTQLADLGVPDRYVDALTGHTPKSILAKHYTDYNPSRLRGMYEKAGIKVLQESKPSSEAAKTTAIEKPSTASKRMMTLDMMRDAMAALRQQIELSEKKAVDEESEKTAEEMKGKWAAIDFLKGQLRKLEDQYEAAESAKSTSS